MTYLISIAVVLILCIFLLFSFGRSALGRTVPVKTGSSLTVAQNSPQITKKLTREQIAQRLKKLKESPAPTNLRPAAMCYKMAATPDRIEYICPVCGERTLYSSQASGNYQQVTLVREDIPECRQLVKSITGLSLSIDESEFCRKCSPRVGSPAMTLIIRYPGEKEPRQVKGISAQDLTLISEFLSGKNRHEGERGSETPLVDYIPRLLELLGVTVK